MAHVKKNVFQTIVTFCALFLLCAMLMRPKVSIAGVQKGLNLCTGALIPSMFPFLIVSKMLLSSRFAGWLGLLVRPYTKLLGFNDDRVGSTVLLGQLGGFAAGASNINSLYQRRVVTAQQASLLLCCTIGAGPGFWVSTVGVAFLNNATGGWLLFASSTAASLVCGAAAAAIIGKTAPITTTAPLAEVKAPSFFEIMQSSLHAMATVCGCVVFFSFVSAVVLPGTADGWAQYFVLLPLEFTSACQAASSLNTPYRLFLCSAALSVLSGSIVVQVRALTAPEISLMPLLISRVLHLPVAWGFLKLMLWLYPGAQTTATQLWRNVYVQLPADGVVVLFIMLGMLFSAFPAKSSLRSGKKPL